MILDTRLAVPIVSEEDIGQIDDGPEHFTRLSIISFLHKRRGILIHIYDYVMDEVRVIIENNP